MINQWVNAAGDSLTTLWQQVISFLPNLIGALVVFIIGLIIASLLEKVVERVLFYTKLDTLLRKAEVEGYLERANIKLNVGLFIGKLVYWFIVVAFLQAASDILQFNAFSGFLSQILGFIPQVIVGALILLAAMVVANFLRQLVTTSVAGAQLAHAKGLGALAWWVVVVFGFLAALQQIGVNPGIIQTLVMGLIGMLALAGGLAFGLGGKEHASRFLSKWGEELRK